MPVGGGGDLDLLANGLASSAPGEIGSRGCPNYTERGPECHVRSGVAPGRLGVVRPSPARTGRI